jgi:hypothetical protein
MAANIRKLIILVVLAAVMLLGFGQVALSYVDIGLTDIEDTGETALSVPDLSAVPQSVADDAIRLAQELFGDYHERYNDFVNQLLATYVEARDKDIVVLFNPGGWGWDFLENSPGWQSISVGIESELDSLGYKPLLLDFRRTKETYQGLVREFVELVSDYPSKAENLARRVEFLTAHNPDLKVIITGESNGTVISDRVMHILQDNPRVYSIQTGIPFWHRNVMQDRTLVLNSNGVTPDSFSRGDIPAMVWASLKALLGFSSPDDEDPGRIFYFLRAPGHDYRWQYPGVYSQIKNFLEENLGFKRGQ